MSIEAQLEFIFGAAILAFVLTHALLSRRS